MNILVTGSSGFLGRWLTQDLKDLGHHVIGIDKVNDFERDESPHSFYHLDLRKPRPSISERIDIIVHLASSKGGFLRNWDDSDLIEDELAMIMSLRNLYKASGSQKLIYLSSINIFECSGVQPEHAFCSEAPRSAYAQAKLATEKYIERNFDCFSILRPTNFFGPLQPRLGKSYGQSHVIPDLIEKIKTQSRIEVFGDGTQKRNFIHLSDLSNFIQKVFASNTPQYSHLRSKLVLSIKELVEILMREHDTIKPIDFRPEYMSYELMPLTSFESLSAHAIKWTPKVYSLAEGLRDRQTMNRAPKIAAKANHKFAAAQGL